MRVDVWMNFDIWLTANEEIAKVKKKNTLLSGSGPAKFKISKMSVLRNGIINQIAAAETSGQDFDRSIM